MKRMLIILLMTVMMAPCGCQASFIYYPDRTLASAPDAIGLPYESVSYRSADGLLLHGWWVPSRRGRAVTLFCHGNAGNISHRLQTIRILNDLGLSVFIFDYRGYGQSEGTPTEEGTYRDALGAWRYLTVERGISPSSIIVHGRSLGGSIAAWLARKTGPKMLVLESTFSSLRDAVRFHCACAPVSWMFAGRYETAEYVKGVACPVLVIHSRDDEVVPFALGEKVFLAAKGRKEFCEIRGGHNDGFVVSGREYRAALDGFVTVNLQTGGDDHDN